MVKQNIAIIGASSRLGSAVVSALQNSPAFGPLAVRIVDDSALSDSVCDKARFNQLCTDLTDVAGCFLCSSTDDNYSIDCSEAEAQRGKTVVDACAVAGVPYVIYNTRLGVYDSIGVPSRHMDACAEVERYFKVKGIQLTSLVVTFTYEQLLVQPFLPIRTANGILDLDYPIKDMVLPVVSVTDVGCMVEELFHQYITKPTSAPYINKTVSVCAQHLSLKHMVTTLNTVLAPRIFRENQKTVEEYKRKCFDGAEHVAHMFAFFVRVDQRASADIANRLYPKTKSFSDWLKIHYELVASVFDTIPYTPIKTHGAI